MFNFKNKDIRMMFCSSISYGVLQHIEASVVLDDGDLEVKCGL